MSSKQKGTKTRCASLTLLALVAGTAFAAANHEATYTVGNLDSIHVGTAGVVRVDDAGITFRAGSSVVDIPHDRIASATLTPKDAVASRSHGLKVWERLGSKKRQDLLVNFKDAAGKAQTMTLEVNESSAHDIHDTLAGRATSPSSSPLEATKHADAPKRKTKEPAVEKQQAKTKDAAQPQQPSEQAKAERSEPSKSWWGDDYWKTTRNRDSWATQSAAITK